MLRLLLNSALILTLISCPLRCTAGLQLFSVLNIQSSDSPAAKACPSCCSRSESQPSESSDSSSSDSNCCCVCSGAIILVEPGTKLVFEQVGLSCILDDMHETIQVGSSHLSSHHFKPAESSGRVVRTLLMSFLC